MSNREIAGKPLKEIERRFDDVLDIALKLPEYCAPDNKGGYLALMHQDTDQLLAIVRIGQIVAQPIEKWRTYHACALEKCMRMHDMAISEAHLSTFQSRNAAKNKYPGGIFCDQSRLCVSFSGLPALWDEALCLVSSIMLHWLPEEVAEKIAAISSNPYFAPLLDRVKEDDEYKKQLGT